jgi:hypothetical protein
MAKTDADTLYVAAAAYHDVEIRCVTRRQG